MIKTNNVEGISKDYKLYKKGNVNQENKKEDKENDTEVIETKDEEETKDNERNIEIKDLPIIKNNSESNMFTTRDLSWLEFNERILDLADKDIVPLFEKFKFLAISSSNLDEFTTVRISKLSQSKNLNLKGFECSYEAKMLQEEINKKFLPKQNDIFNKLMKELKDLTGYELVRGKKELSEEEKEFVKKYFDKHIKPLITPIVADTTKPFPLVKNKALYLGITIEDNRFNNDSVLFATIKIPDSLPRIIKIEHEVKKYTEDELKELERKNKERNVSNGKKLILLEDLIKLNLGKIFINKDIKSIATYRLLRNLNYDISNNDFIVNVMKETLKRRDNSGNVIRLDVSQNTKKSILKIYKKAFNVVDKSIVEQNIIDYSFCMELSKLFNKEIIDNNSYPDFVVRDSDDILDGNDIFDVIDEKDIICHHPYDSYDIVVDFLREAAKDPEVVSIRQTLYRVADNSKIVKQLIKAAENGKEVTVVLEATARFDEANNLRNASKLEAAGANIIYGISGIKVHAKMCLITKLKKNKLYQYVHIGTGNYNEKNSKIYTDLSLFTSRKNITNEITKLFGAITGFSEPIFKRILVPNYNMKEELIKMIDNEIKAASENKSAKIIIKCNALTDKDVMDKLYEASSKNVKVILIVRGSCGMNFVNNNLQIKSILGRFLEHSRIWYFENNQYKYYIGSSDLMPRNLYNRIELMVPIDKDDYKYMRNLLNTYVFDTSEYAHIKTTKVIKNDNESNAQTKFINNYVPQEKLENVSKIFTTRK